MESKRKRIHKKQQRQEELGTNRPVGRPRKIWEDEINDYLRPEETEETKSSDLENNSSWKAQAKKQIRMESKRKVAKKDSSEMEIHKPNEKDELSAFSLPKQICAQATPFPGRYEIGRRRHERRCKRILRRNTRTWSSLGTLTTTRQVNHHWKFAVRCCGS